MTRRRSVDAGSESTSLRLGTIRTPGGILSRTPQPAGFRRLLPLAWLTARAFTANKGGALIAMPWMAALLAPGLARRTVFESDDHDGTVTVALHRPMLDFLLTTLFTFVALASLAATYAAYGRWFVAFAVVLLVVGLWPVRQLMRSARPTGPETPAGNRYAISGLAQRPGTRMSAIQLTKALISTVPQDSVLIATARDEELVRKYVRAGFTPGEQRRIYKVL